MIQCFEQIQKALVSSPALLDVNVVSHYLADFDYDLAEKAPVAVFKLCQKAEQHSK